MTTTLHPLEQMTRAWAICPPRIFTNHLPQRSFIGQDVHEVHPGELWMFTNYGRKPTQFTEADAEAREPIILKSVDNGRSWGNAQSMGLPWDIDGWLSDGGCSVLRLNSGRLIFIAHRSSSRLKDKGSHGVPVMSLSADDGRSWSPARLLIEQEDIYYVMNQRLIQLQQGPNKGRLILPFSARDPRVSLEQYGEGINPCLSRCFLSDDEGATWRLSIGKIIDSTLRGAQEPCVAEVGPDEIVLLYRSGRGAHQCSVSLDGGETWSEPEGTSLAAACSPLTLTTLPDGRLLLAYNPGEPIFEESYYARNPLAYTVSADGGQNWSEPVVVDDQPGQQLIYPSVTPTSEGLLFTYCAFVDPGDGGFSFGPEAHSIGGGKCCLVPYPGA